MRDYLTYIKDELVWYLRLVIGYAIGIGILLTMFVFVACLLVKHGRLIYTLRHFSSIKVRYRMRPGEPIPMQWVFPDRVSLLACWHPNPRKWNFGYTSHVR